MHRVAQVEYRPLKVVSIDKVIFDITPASVKEADDDDCLMLDYVDCHRAVFGRELPPIKPNELELESIRQACSEFRAKARPFFLAIMYGHREAGKDGGRFKPSYLYDKGSRWRWMKYRSAVAERYGHVDEASLSTFFEADKTTCLKQLEIDETLVAEWLIGHGRRSGKLNLDQLWLNLEPKLSPIWLALEPKWKPTVLPGESDVTKRRRSEAIRLVRKIRSTVKDNAYFKMRALAASAILPSVLHNQGIRITDLNIKKTEQTCLLAFWFKIGLALMHWDLLTCPVIKDRNKGLTYEFTSDYTRRPA